MSDLSNLEIFRIWKILATSRERTMHHERLIIEINLVQNYISDNFHFDHKAVRSQLNFWVSLGTKGGNFFELLKVWQVASTGYVFYIPMRKKNPQNILGTPILPGWATFSPGLGGQIRNWQKLFPLRTSISFRLQIWNIFLIKINFYEPFQIKYGPSI